MKLKIVPVFLFAALLISACSSVGKYVLPTHRFVGAVVVSPEVNPNSSGRPSPISVYFFQLKASDTFNSTDFFAIYNNPQKALSADFIDVGKITLAPGSRTEVSFPLDDNTKFIGVVAAYENLPQSVWRAVVPMNGWGTERVYVYLNKLSVVVSKVGGDGSSTSGVDLGSLGDKAKNLSSSVGSTSSSGSSASSGGDSSSSNGGWKDKLLSLDSNSSSGSGSSSGSSNGSSGGFMQKYQNIRSDINGNSGSNTSSSNNGSNNGSNNSDNSNNQSSNSSSSNSASGSNT